MSFEYITKDFIFCSDSIHQIQNEVPTLNIFPCVYIIYSKDSKQAYIGETTNISNRIKQHLSSPAKNKLKNIKIIFSAYFNKSSVLDIESNLIKNMDGDKQFNLLNGNYGIFNHSYYQQTEYKKTFEKIWDNLKFDKLVKRDLLDIQNSDLFKYSPYKSLSLDQYNAIEEYLLLLTTNQNIKPTTFIQGSAGTGKTILAVYIIKLLLSDIDPDDFDENNENKTLIELSQKVKNNISTNKEKLKIALVIPMTSLRNTLKKVFKSINGLSQNMVIGPNDVSKDYYDLIIVDEAHRLKRRKNITGYAEFDKTNKHFGLDVSGNELDWIMKSSNNQLFFYDENQSIRPADIEKIKFDKIKLSSSLIQLKSQMRVEGGGDYIEFVDKLLNASKDLKIWKSTKYELKLFKSMPDMISELESKEKLHGLCRTISGYSWKWLSSKSNQPDVTIDGIDLYWNRTNKDWINSTKNMTEMGCIHTTQGYDLNYSGIIFGSDITYNQDTKRIEIIKENYFDRNGRVGISDEQLHDYIINIYKTIMYRGIKGTYVYCYHKELYSYFNKFIQ